MSDYKNLITRNHLAELLSVKPLTINRWEKIGLPVVHIGVGKLPRYNFMDVMDWIHKQENVSVE